MPMITDQFYDMVQATMIKCIEVMRSKGDEYTEGSDNKLANFESEALELDLTAPQVIHIFANKHQKAINNYRKTGEVESEALEMRFVDRVNYLFLELAQYIALGYEPREDWLIEALAVNEEPKVIPFIRAVDSEGKPVEIGESQPTVAEEDAKGDDQDDEPCCGAPGNSACCEEAPVIPPPNAGPDEQRETLPQTRQQEQRRRPKRPRRRGAEEFESGDDGVPIAKPDKRYDPQVLRERGRTNLTE